MPLHMELAQLCFSMCLHMYLHHGGKPVCSSFVSCHGSAAHNDCESSEGKPLKCQATPAGEQNHLYY